jgi:hypothetical protein
MDSKKGSYQDPSCLEMIQSLLRMVASESFGKKQLEAFFQSVPQVEKQSLSWVFLF